MKKIVDRIVSKYTPSLYWDDDEAQLTESEGIAWLAGWSEGFDEGRADVAGELYPEIERLREALRKVRRAIVEADPEIVTCTLWLKDTMTETAVDCIDAALGEGKE